MKVSAEYSVYLQVEKTATSIQSMFTWTLVPSMLSEVTACINCICRTPLRNMIQMFWGEKLSKPYYYGGSGIPFHSPAVLLTSSTNQSMTLPVTHDTSLVFRRVNLSVISNCTFDIIRFLTLKNTRPPYLSGHDISLLAWHYCRTLQPLACGFRFSVKNQALFFSNSKSTFEHNLFQFKI